jgi:hypothetical protein
MPSYLFEVTTEQGIERHNFTLDDDRTLGPQVVQILEELRLRGIVLRGSHDDELGVFWEGRELSLTQRPGEQGIAASRPVSLRMRERVVPVIDIVDHSVPRGVLASSVFGYVGALLAWIIVGFWTDTSSILSSYARIDQLTMALLGATIGAAVLGGIALRTRGVVAAGLAAGLLLGAIAGVGGATIALALPLGTTIRAFLLVRLAGWAAAGLLAAALLACYPRPFNARRVGESALLGLLAGAIGGALFALPGPSEVWQGLAFLVLGAGVGLAVGGPYIWGAVAIVEAAPTRHMLPNVLSLREWPVYDESSIVIGDAQIGCQAGALALYPPTTGAMLNDRPVSAPTFMPAGGRLTVGLARFRIRMTAARA